jgi:membrane associated rhomboid family serine protease
MYLSQLYETLLGLPAGLQSVLLSLLFMYLMHISDGLLFKRRLAASYSIKPRKSNRLLSPMLAHTLHNNWGHLFGNSVPFVVLGSIIALPKVQAFWLTTISVMVVGGLGTWILGSGGNHLGASGLVTGYFGYILSQGFFNQDSQSVMVGILVGVFYFGIFRMVFRRFKGVSNVMHFFGFFGGVLGAWLMPWMNQLI